MIVLLALALGGCTSQFTLGPAAWSAPPVIPGFTPVALPGGGFVEEPTSLLQTPAATPEQTILGALQEAQATREAVRRLAR
jgi:hypothetical protein